MTSDSDNGDDAGDESNHGRDHGRSAGGRPEQGENSAHDVGDDEQPYEVGYGRPPKHSQVAKGQVLNPAGRPRGSKN